MNKEVLLFELDQAVEELQSIIEEVDRDEFNKSADMALAVRLTSTLNYVFKAWNFRDLTLREVSELADDEYEKLTFRVPLLDPRLHIEETEINERTSQP